VDVNMGSVDREIRAVVGLAIIAIGVAHKTWWGAIGLLPLLTAATGRCPGYLPLGISTRKSAAPPPQARV